MNKKTAKRIELNSLQFKLRIETFKACDELLTQLDKYITLEERAENAIYDDITSLEECTRLNLQAEESKYNLISLILDETKLKKADCFHYLHSRETRATLKNSLKAYKRNLENFGSYMYQTSLENFDFDKIEI